MTATGPYPYETLIREIGAVQESPEALLALLEDRLPKVDDDALYWQVLLAAWVKNGRQEHIDRWLALFRAKRRNRQRGMKHADRKAWRALPDPVVVYRAVAPGESGRVLSWSLNSATLRRIYPDREIVRRVVRKRDVAFYVRRRHEDEIIIIPEGEKN